MLYNLISTYSFSCITIRKHTAQRVNVAFSIITIPFGYIYNQSSFHGSLAYSVATQSLSDSLVSFRM